MINKFDDRFMGYKNKSTTRCWFALWKLTHSIIKIIKLIDHEILWSLITKFTWPILFRWIQEIVELILKLKNHWSFKLPIIPWPTVCGYQTLKWNMTRSLQMVVKHLMKGYLRRGICIVLVQNMGCTFIWEANMD